MMGNEMSNIKLPLFGHMLTERFITGLAPDIPEDLYMLIKKVRLNGPFGHSVCRGDYEC